LKPDFHQLHRLLEVGVLLEQHSLASAPTLSKPAASFQQLQGEQRNAGWRPWTARDRTGWESARQRQRSDDGGNDRFHWETSEANGFGKISVRRLDEIKAECADDAIEVSAASDATAAEQSPGWFHLVEAGATHAWGVVSLMWAQEEAFMNGKRRDQRNGGAHQKRCSLLERLRQRSSRTERRRRSRA